MLLLSYQIYHHSHHHVISLYHSSHRYLQICTLGPIGFLKNIESAANRKPSKKVLAVSFSRKPHVFFSVFYPSFFVFRSHFFTQLSDRFKNVLLRF